jgi:CTP:molybdopterin cytidylyltransferase MocA
MKQNNNLEQNFSAIILAAGKSERLGYPKLSLKYNKENSFIEQIAMKFKTFGCNEIMAVVNQSGYDYIQKHGLKLPINLKLVINEHTEWHRFYSLKTGANGLTGTQVVFVHNVDNPFVNHEVLHNLLVNSNKADYIIPEFNKKGGHPFLISSKIVNDLKTSDFDQKHLKDFLSQYSRLRVPVSDENILVNINTLDEYKKYF